MNKSPAYSLVEILLVLIILALVSIPGFFVYIRSQANQRLQASAEIFSNHLRQARTFSRDAREGRTWGLVRVTESNYDLVSFTDTGATTTEENYHLQTGILFKNNFDIRFSKLSGDPLASQPVKVGNKYNQCYMVDILATGVVETKPTDCI